MKPVVVSSADLPPDGAMLIARGALEPDPGSPIAMHQELTADGFVITFTLRARVNPRRVVVLRGLGG